jgi:hypothetical protein
MTLCAVLHRPDPRYVEDSVETLVSRRVLGPALGCGDLSDQ